MIRVSKIVERLVQSFIAERLVMAFEHPSERALKDYLERHPKADKKLHWVKKNETSNPKKMEQPKPEQKTQEPAKPTGHKAYTIPKAKNIEYKANGGLDNLGEWKVKIQIGNSMTKGKKVGDFDDVGYVAVNAEGDDIIPIARADEHQSGYDYLWELQDRKQIDNARNYITLYPMGNSYPEYTVQQEEMPKYIAVLKKWRSYGGQNGAISTKKYVTDMDEFIELNGKVPSKSQKPSKPAARILDSLKDVMGKMDTTGSALTEAARKFHKETEPFTYNCFTGVEDIKETMDAFRSIPKACDDNDHPALKKALKDVAEAMRVSINQTTKTYWSGDVSTAFFGHGDESKNRINEITNKKSAPTEGKRRITPAAQSLFESLGKAGKSGESGRDNIAFFKDAQSIVDKVADMKAKSDKLQAAYERAVRAIANDDLEGLQRAILSHDGIKNIIHTQLKNDKAEGKTTSDYFGDVEFAIAELDKISNT